MQKNTIHITITKEQWDTKQKELEEIKEKQSYYLSSDEKKLKENLSKIEGTCDIEATNEFVTITPSPTKLFDLGVQTLSDTQKHIGQVVSLCISIFTVTEILYSEKLVDEIHAKIADLWMASFKIQFNDDLSFYTNNPILQAFTHQLHAWTFKETQPDGKRLFILERPMFWEDDINYLADHGFSLLITEEHKQVLGEMAEVEKQIYYKVQILPHEEGIKILLYKHIDKKYKDKLETHCKIKYYKKYNYENPSLSEWEWLSFIERKLELDNEEEKQIGYFGYFFTLPTIRQFFKNEGFNVEVDPSLIKELPPLPFETKPKYKLYNYPQVGAFNSWIANEYVGTTELPTGTGKSVDKDTYITCRINGNWITERISNIVDKYFNNNSDGIVFIKDEIMIPALDTKSQETEYKRVYAVSRHKPTTNMIKVTTKSGRIIKCTTDHNFLVMTENGIELKNHKDLKVLRDFIPLACRLPKIVQSHVIDLSEYYQTKVFVNRKSNPYSWSKYEITDYDILDRTNQYHSIIPRNLKIVPDLAYFFGFFLAEGSFHRITPTISQYNIKTLEKMKSIAMDNLPVLHSNTKPYVKEDRNCLILPSIYARTFKSFIDMNIPVPDENVKGKFARRKTIPTWLFDTELAPHILKGFREGDGWKGYSKDDWCTCSSSKKLIYQLFFLKLISSDWTYINLYEKKESEHLSMHIKNTQRKEYSKFQIIPPVLKTLMMKLHYQIKPFISSTKEWVEEKRNIGLSYFRKEMQKEKKKLKQVRNLSEQMKKQILSPLTPKEIEITEGLLHGDVSWDQIVSIEEYTTNDFVYDFSVKDYENFMLGNGLFVHNTMLGMEAINHLKTWTLVVVPTINLKNQWVHFLKKWLKVPEEHIGEFYGPKKEVKPITIATMQSASKYIKKKNKESINNNQESVEDELLKFAEEVGKISDKFGLLVTDEGHHLSAPVWRRVGVHLKTINRLSLTATPRREDRNEALIFFMMGDVIFKTTYYKAAAFSQPKLICPIKYERITVDLNATEQKILELHAQIKSKKYAYKHAWYSQKKQIAEEIKQLQEELNELWSQHPYIQLGGSKKISKMRIIHCYAENKFHKLLEILKQHKNDKILIFNEYIKGTQLISNFLNYHKIPHMVMVGSTPEDERKDILGAFSEASSSIILTTTVLDEGIDVPKCNVVIIFNGTKTPRQMIQRIGRGCRYQPCKIEYAYELITDQIEIEQPKPTYYHTEKTIYYEELNRIMNYEYNASQYRSPIEVVEPDKQVELIQQVLSKKRCKTIGCFNEATKDSDFCGIHKYLKP